MRERAERRGAPRSLGVKIALPCGAFANLFNRFAHSAGPGQEYCELKSNPQVGINGSAYSLGAVLCAWGAILCAWEATVYLGSNFVCPGINSVCPGANVCAGVQLCSPGTNSVCLGSNSVCPGEQFCVPGEQFCVPGGSMLASNMGPCWLPNMASC